MKTLLIHQLSLGLLLQIEFFHVVVFNHAVDASAD